MNEWLADIDTLDADDDCFVIVTVAGVRGSAPREVGAKMLVTAKSSIGTIGGGQLEYQCTRIAVDRLLRDGASTDRRRLGAKPSRNRMAASGCWVFPTLPNA